MKNAMNEFFALCSNIGRCLTMILIILTAIPVAILRFVFLWCKPIRHATGWFLHFLDDLMWELL